MKNATDPRLSKLAEALEMRSVRPNTRATYLRCAAKFLDAVGKPIKLTLCSSCGAHAVQRGPLPSPYPTSARAPPEVAA